MIFSCSVHLLKRLISVCIIFSCFAANASLIDLSTAGSTALLSNAIVKQSSIQPAGSGVFQPFVRVKNTPSAIVEGYNTTAATGNSKTSPVLNTMSENKFNRAITLGDVAVVNVDGTDYREFLLDINESNGKSPTKLEAYLSLDEIQIFMGGTANSSVDTFTDPSGTRVLQHDGDLVWDLDGLNDDWIALNYGLESGSGASDMALYVADTLFDSYIETDNLVLYSMFGLQGEGQYNLLSGECNEGATTNNGKKDVLCDFGNSAGFEEWASNSKNGTPRVDVPEPQSFGFIFIGLISLLFVRRRQLA